MGGHGKKKEMRAYPGTGTSAEEQCHRNDLQPRLRNGIKGYRKECHVNWNRNREQGNLGQVGPDLDSQPSSARRTVKERDTDIPN